MIPILDIMLNQAVEYTRIFSEMIVGGKGGARDYTKNKQEFWHHQRRNRRRREASSEQASFIDLHNTPQSVHSLQFLSKDSDKNQILHYTTMSSLLTAGANKFRKAREWATPTLKDSAFVERGVLTPEEFVKAGDELVYKCPTWQWESGDPSKRKKYLPKDKQVSNRN